MNTDLLIVGGGPAGLNAAYKAASNGLKTTVIDRWFTLGGQLNQQTQFYNNLPQHFENQRGYQLANYLIDRLRKLDVKILENHKMIGAYNNGSIGVTDGKSTFQVQAANVIMTTGAMEEPDIFPGWTLPGVMTAGAAQILINRERVLPGKRALILGSNNFALEVARQLNDCGVAVKGIVESRNELLSQNDELLCEVDIPVLLDSAIERAIGKGEVEKVYVNTDGIESVYDVDLICIAKGMTPIFEPFEIMSCDLTYQEKLGGWLPKYDSRFETTSPSVYIAGNAAGITNIGGILLTGEIAAASILEKSNAANSLKIEEEKKYLWGELYRIESAENPSALDARLDVIRNFHHETGIQLPVYLDSVFGGLTNG
ncbi:sarcosine oxidase subunit alpha [Lentibacillus halodurans]|uniref:Sarcosine oxidase subunit alpha n=1 Tax=Lentibacillus halodurans TaxID=237679 RepID=A0A1I1AKP7_9BACI|nr:FAD-dependent oxidoreductase [Lentibacillus halodurans]SFB38599.1 sarcosine oxidase subunit alpha [Lentibacillus halodurans]